MCVPVKLSQIFIQNKEIWCYYNFIIIIMAFKHKIDQIQ